MKKTIIVLLLSLLPLSTLIFGCGEKYSDAKDITEKYIVLIEDYIAGLNKAENAKDVAKTINRFADGMEKIMPEMRKITEKYPELKDKSNPPDELKDTQKRAEEMGKKLVESMMQLMPYMMDKEVQKAQERLGKSMMQE